MVAEICFLINLLCLPLNSMNIYYYIRIKSNRGKRLLVLIVSIVVNVFALIVSIIHLNLIF